MSGEIRVAEGAEAASASEAPDGALEEVALTVPDERDRLLGELDGLYEKWRPKAEEGDAGAALIVLSIIRQRAALLGLSGRPAAALRVATTAVPSGEEKPGEVKVVVEYVNDWRDVLRRRA